MIFRHFADSRTGGHSYLFASKTTRKAAIVNPRIDALEDYQTAIRELDLDLVATLLTHTDQRLSAGSAALGDRYGARLWTPDAQAFGQGPIEVARPGQSVMVGDLVVHVIQPPSGAVGQIAYRVSGYTFQGNTMILDAASGSPDPSRTHETPWRTTAATDGPNRSADPRLESIAREREAIGSVPIEQLIIEDLSTSLAEDVLTPKEARVAQIYIQTMRSRGLKPPSAAEMAELMPEVDRTALHVIVHNIRWKQIDLGRLPLQLNGQTSKWLRGLQTKPEFTSHEREFMRAYFQLLQHAHRPPSGPEISKALGAHRSVQWVRKRAHTIRRKQREFNMPELILARKSHEKSEEREELGNKPLPSRFRGETDFEMRPQP